MDINYGLFSVIIILISAKFGSYFAVRLKQPEVLGELLAGVIIGTSALGWIHESNLLIVLAQIGAIILLFEAGIGSDYEAFMTTKTWAFFVACVGVFCPFLFGYIIAQAFSLSVMQSIFIGATLTATSVGITVRVFRDLGKCNSKEAQIVIGAAVIDDIIGLIILAAVIGVISAGSISWQNITFITFLAVFFLFGSLLIGNLAAKPILDFIHQLRIRGLLFLFSIIFCFIMAYVANLVGLAPIVGAFASGLILSRTEHQEHLVKRIKPLAAVFIPIFFVMMGVSVNIRLFNPFNPANHLILFLSLILFLAAVIGKIISGFAVKGEINKWLIGVGMIPRGEVGLIFAAYGLAHDIINQSLYAVILLVVFFTTMITPPLLKYVIELKR